MTYARGWLSLWLVGLVACGRVANQSTPADAADPFDVAIAPDDVAVASCAATPAGLAARWRGDSNMTDDLGRYNGAAVGPIAYTPGRHGSAFALNGTNALISIADGDALWPTGSFSIEAWVTASSPGRVVTKYECGGKCGSVPVNFSSWSLDILAGGVAHFALRSGPMSAADMKLTDQKVITDGAWHHLVAVRDIQAKKLTLYVDGAVAAAEGLSGQQLDPLSNTDGEVDPVTIGAATVTGMTTYIDYLHGAIDEVAYFSAPMTADEVAAIYAAPDGECH